MLAPGHTAQKEQRPEQHQQQRKPITTDHRVHAPQGEGPAAGQPSAQSGPTHPGGHGRIPAPEESSSFFFRQQQHFHALLLSQHSAHIQSRLHQFAHATRQLVN